jgi:DNA-binding transcriptional ArsR family regulator
MRHNRDASGAIGDLQVFKAGFFRALAHPVRIRILELLVKDDRSVQELQEALGLEQPVVSQQLAVLRSSNIVSGRKEGVSVRYAVRDPLVGTLLDAARQIFNNHLVGTQDLLRQLKREGRRRERPRTPRASRSTRRRRPQPES